MMADKSNHHNDNNPIGSEGVNENAGEGINRRDFLTTNEAAKQLGVSYYTVYEYIREKRLVAEMVSGVYIIPKRAVEEFKAKPTGRTRVKPPPWRVYRAGAKVRGLDITVQVRTGQQERLYEKLHRLLDQQEYLFNGTMQRYIFEDEDNPALILISLVWKDTELPDESMLDQELARFKSAFADVLDWTTARYTRKRAILHT
jgi:excisionase family DNA binding protein